MPSRFRIAAPDASYFQKHAYIISATEKKLITLTEADRLHKLAEKGQDVEVRRFIEEATRKKNAGAHAEPARGRKQKSASSGDNGESLTRWPDPLIKGV
jgi:hypothetical protein